MELRLMTSNPNKLAEYQRLGIEATIGDIGPDLPEVQGTALEVVLYKALASGAGTLIEDTSLDVEGACVGVDVRWLMEHLPDLRDNRATFRVLLALNDGVHIRVYEGQQSGHIDGSRQKDGSSFGFDSWFIPDGAAGKSLWELEQLGQKDTFSARAKAAASFKDKKERIKISIEQIAPWEGAWQEGAPPQGKSGELRAKGGGC